VVVACDYDLVDRIGNVIPSAVVLDMLFWFWSEMPTPNHDNCLIVAQNFFGVQERAAKSTNTVVVSPFQVVEHANGTKQRSTLVNLGGFTSPHHDSGMAATYIELILPALKSLLESEGEVVIAGGDHILAAIEEMLPGRCDLRALRHDEMKQEMMNCQRFVSVPGIGAIYESFSARAPTFFLPPTNLTQLLQSESLRTQLRYPYLSLPFSWRTGSKTSQLSESEFISSLFHHYRSHTTTHAASLDKAIKRFAIDVLTSPGVFDGFAHRIERFMAIESGPPTVDRVIAQIYAGVEGA